MKLKMFVIGMMLSVIPFGELKAQGGNWKPPTRVVLQSDTGVFFTRESEGVLIEKAIDRVIIQRMERECQETVERLTSDNIGLKFALDLRAKEIAVLESDVVKVTNQRDYFKSEAEEQLLEKQKLQSKSKWMKRLFFIGGAIGGYYVGRNVGGLVSRL
jgi:hypothetical protein